MTALNTFCERLLQINQGFCQDVPSMTRTQFFTDELISFLFPIRTNRHHDIYDVKNKLHELKYQLRKLLNPLKPKLTKDLELLTEEFFNNVPNIYNELISDAEIYHKSDPASYCLEEVILCYPGYYAMMTYRFAHLLYSMQIPILPRVMTEYAHSKTGIDINPGAKIGSNFYIDHGTGIVIGETVEIGNNVKIYQGVTLGALYVEKNLANKKRHPTIQDNVIIYAGSTILGGETVIGHDTIIGGNCWVTASVDPNSVVYRQPKIVIRDSKDFIEPINFSI